MMVPSSSNDGVHPNVKPRRYHLSLYWITSIGLGAFAVAAAGVGYFGTDNYNNNSNAWLLVVIDNIRNHQLMVQATTTILPIWITLYWSLIQWIPRIVYNDVNNYHKMNTAAWDFWETDATYRTKQSGNESSSLPDEIPTVYIQDHDVDDLLPYIESKYGKHWRRRPLLLKGLWKIDELMNLPNTRSDDINNTTIRKYRRLSLHGLLRENLTIPYFTDARKIGAISPDGIGTIQDIMKNITKHNAPHKIATQLLLQTYPELIEEVAPLSIITKLFDPHYHHQQKKWFGSSSSSVYFTPNAIRGVLNGPPVQLFPKLTTVPLFVANSHPLLPSDTTTNSSSNNSGSSSNDPQTASQLAHTALHCEPIGNIAVQLSGEKLWTLIRPEYSNLLRPYIAPDGRAFFVSSLPISDITNSSDGNRSGRRIPYYQAVTEAGDALWVPTWTWHRVDYVSSASSSSASTSSLLQDESNSSSSHHRSTKANVQANGKEHSSHIAIGASIFHFRPLGFIQNNPLFAILIIPAIILELIGFNTQ